MGRAATPSCSTASPSPTPRSLQSSYLPTDSLCAVRCCRTAVGYSATPPSVLRPDILVLRPDIPVPGAAARRFGDAVVEGRLLQRPRGCRCVRSHVPHT
eukprot:23008-Rhodomonas_salina.7